VLTYCTHAGHSQQRNGKKSTHRAGKVSTGRNTIKYLEVKFDCGDRLYVVVVSRRATMEDGDTRQVSDHETRQGSTRAVIPVRRHVVGGRSS
jgi:hypothetical protein